MTKIYDLSAAHAARLARRICGEANNIPVLFVDGKTFPQSEGRYHYFRWGGKFKTYPGSYQHSTRRILVGRDWAKGLKCPKGCHFTFDISGLKVVRGSDRMDYHPTTEDLRARNFIFRVREGMALNYRKRLAAKHLEKQKQAEQKIYLKQIRNTYVNLYDSERAGNCIEGSLAFAERKLRIPREEIMACPWLVQVAANKLLAAQDNSEHVNRAIRQAWLRETTISI